jgi:hypothetical protein
MEKVLTKRFKKKPIQLTEKRARDYIRATEKRTREIARDEINKWWRKMSKNQINPLNSR